MRGVFVDCTDDLIEVIKRRNLPVPSSITINCGNPDQDTLILLCRDAEVLLVEHTVVTSAFLDACPSIRAVVFMGTGAGTYIDLDDAARRGLRVLTTPGYGDRAVAEHAFALMFAGSRRIAAMDRAIRGGEWLPTGGLQLLGRTVAVIGLAGIGTEFARLAGAIGMNVRAWSRTRRDVDGYTADLDEALAGADVVSLHLALNEQTAGILDTRRLRLPRRGFLLVNTARAGLVDEAALLQGLTDGTIGHAALDVFPDEPLPADSPYPALENTTLTAHAAYMTEDAYAELWKRTLAAFASVPAEPG
jgi:D-3-phosphoglycerate dehydrogenase